MDSLNMSNHSLTVQRLNKIVVENVKKLHAELGSSLTECMYTKALELALKHIGCICRVEDPIPVQVTIGDIDHTIGYCRIDINAYLPDDDGGIRFLFELKHSHITQSVIKQATQQVLEYIKLTENSDTHLLAQYAFVIVFPKSNLDSPYISLIDRYGNKLETLPV